MTLAIIDDSADARMALSYLLKKYLPEIQIIEANDVRSGISIINRFHPEIVFLDVMMPDGSGFDLLLQISNPGFKVVFVSGYDKFALQAFKFSAVDYLVKPVNEDELKETLERLSKAISQQSVQMMFSALQLNIDKRNTKKQLVLRDIENVYIVEVNEIMRCQSSDSYTTFYLVNQKPIVVSRQLKEYEELLEDFDFFRVHQSHLINLNYLQKFQRKDGGHAILKDGTEIPVASRRRELLLEKLTRR